MDIPVFFSGEKIGVLRRRGEGLYTVYEASLPPREGLYRLWVSGGGRCACLGLTAPGREGLSFRRRLTRQQCRALPGAIESAELRPAESGAPAKPAPRPVPAAAAPEPGWIARDDGTLCDPAWRLLALPCALRRDAPGLRRASIGGREYLLFRY